MVCSNYKLFLCVGPETGLFVASHDLPHAWLRCVVCFHSRSQTGTAGIDLRKTSWYDRIFLL